MLGRKKWRKMQEEKALETEINEKSEKIEGQVK
jgi:hypothetical protein